MPIAKAALKFMRACQMAFPNSLFAEYTKADLETIAKYLSLSEDLYQWYAVAAPKKISIRWIGNALELFEPSQLLDAQLGYRWFGINTLNIEALEKLDGWKDEWIVIASVGGSPIIVKVDEKPSSILMAYHGMGYWKPEQVAPDLASFLDFLAEWCLLIKEFGGVQNMYDEDSVLFDSVLERLKEIIELTVGEAFLDNLMKYLI
jgi:hypothetical protein